jgi:protein-tyrosine-phosphatase
MAAAVANARFGQSILAESAGIEFGAGLPAAAPAIEVMRERGLDLSAHSSKDIEQLNLEDYDAVVAMSQSIARKLAHLSPRPVVVWDITDPYGCTLDTYRATADAIEHTLMRLAIQ